MKDNHLPQALYLFTYSILALFLLSFISPFTIGDYKFKPINLISDIEISEEINPEPIASFDSLDLIDSLYLNEPNADSVVDSIKVDPQIATTKIDTCKRGVICIEDFSEFGDAMLAFTESLDNVKKQPVRIAFYGDSFVEGDILTASLRDTLQRVLGGRGVGFVSITSDVSNFRTTVRHSFSNWKSYSIIETYEDEKPIFGIAGTSAIPLQDNFVEYGPAYGATLNKLSIFYSCDMIRKLSYTIRDSIHYDTILYPSKGLKKLELKNLKSKKIRISIADPDSIRLYGVALEDNAGIYVDNLAMRGNSGIGLSQISSTMLKESNNLRPYSLVILQFGLNVVREDDSTNYYGYAQSMIKVVNKFKESMPGSSILILSISDRSSNQNGEFKTIPSILTMRKAQRLVAKKTGVAFWDLFQAMGGENSMPLFVKAKPSLAAKDYTHLNSRGGKVIANKLAKALLYEKEKNDSLKAGI